MKITRIRRISDTLAVISRDGRNQTYLLDTEKKQRRLEQVAGALIVEGKCHVRKGSTGMRFDIDVSKNIQQA